MHQNGDRCVRTTTVSPGLLALFPSPQMLVWNNGTKNRRTPIICSSCYLACERPNLNTTVHKREGAGLEEFCMNVCQVWGNPNKPTYSPTGRQFLSISAHLPASIISPNPLNASPSLCTVITVAVSKEKASAHLCQFDSETETTSPSVEFQVLLSLCGSAGLWFVAGGLADASLNLS
ncbi:hypothetical protein RRG08_043935 [Elysia crispata]|uniref:Uncharacterized protein n=1 Tax=Elysia crispata TaxID=231223 RepID=A0AAE0Y0A7_9GAST|nr:hypothetical protein RRG08_043935 [Elysia crispata]